MPRGIKKVDSITAYLLKSVFTPEPSPLERSADEAVKEQKLQDPVYTKKTNYIGQQ